MTRAFLIALLMACNPQTEEMSADAPEEPTPEAEPAPLDRQTEAQSVVEIPRPRIRARHILIAHTLATSAPKDLERNEAEARTRAEAVGQSLAEGADFAALAKTHSDDGSGKRGGDLGVFTKGVMNATFEEATLALKPGERSGVIQTPFGFHIIERLEVVELSLAHVLIQWAGLRNTRSERSREEALERAEQALALLEAGQTFSTVAREWSDGPFGPRGGSLGWFQKGQMVPQFDDQAFALEPGAHSGIVESPHGFHIIKRVE
jgi:parvulin-like peptidyl-prolyl isomerase